MCPFLNFPSKKSVQAWAAGPPALGFRYARRRGCGTIAWVGIGMNLAVMAAVVAPATIDRLVNL